LKKKSEQPPMAELYMPRLSPFFCSATNESFCYTATRRIRAFSAPVPKPNNAVDESKEKAVAERKSWLVACMRAAAGVSFAKSSPDEG